MSSLDSNIQRYLMSLANKGYSPVTQDCYRLWLSRFSRWLHEKKITPDIINYYRFYLSSSGVSKSTQNSYLIALRSFFAFMDKEGSPIFSKERIELAKVPDKPINFLTSSQIKRMFKEVRMVNHNKKLRFTRTKERAILELFFSTGLRISELRNLNREQINIKRGEFTIVGKGGKARLIFLSDQAKFWLKKYLKLRKDKYPPLFVYSLTGKLKRKRLGIVNIEKIVDKYARKAHIPMRVTPHMLRHAYASDLLRNGANLRLVQELLGHKNISTTQIYTHISNPELREGYLKYHSGNFASK